MTNVILAEITASVAELKRNPMGSSRGRRRTACCNSRQECAGFYCIPALAFEALLERLEDLELNRTADDRIGEKVVTISPDDL